MLHLDENLFQDVKLREASYGGAFDIEDDMFFTKEELMEFGYDLVDQFSAWSENECSLSNLYMSSPTDLVIEVLDEDEGVEYQSEVNIDMRKIKLPKDIYKYSDDILKQWKDSYLEYHQEDNIEEYDQHNFDESLKGTLYEASNKKYLNYLVYSSEDNFEDSLDSFSNKQKAINYAKKYSQKYDVETQVVAVSSILKSDDPDKYFENEKNFGIVWKSESLKESIVGNARNWLIDKEDKSHEEAAEILTNSSPEEIEKIALKYTKGSLKEDYILFYDKDIDKNINNITGTLYFNNSSDAWSKAYSLVKDGYQVLLDDGYSYDNYRFNSLDDFGKWKPYDDESLEEDINDVVSIEVPDVITDIKETDIIPEGPQVGEDIGIADMLLTLINSENDTIKEYNTFKANLESHPEFISIIDDITNEENNHIGMLQTLLKQISPNVETIKQGEIEAEKELIDDSQSFEIDDFEVDDSFNNGFGGIYV